MENARARGQRLAREALARGDSTEWFEELYATARGDEASIQWADMEPNPHLVEWLDVRSVRGEGKRALVIGCGLGDDAEELARRGFEVVAFDIAPTAIAWCRRRFPSSSVKYVVADVMSPLPVWMNAFDLAIEVYTLQVLPPDLRLCVIQHLRDLLAANGTVLVICRGREPEDDGGPMPWPLTRAELTRLTENCLRTVRFEDFVDREGTRRFRAEYRKEVAHIERRTK